MTSERIQEIQKGTAYPDSVSVMLALKQVWNECEQNRTIDDIIRQLKARLETNAMQIFAASHSNGDKYPFKDPACNEAFLILAHLQAIEDYFSNVETETKGTD